MTARDPLGAATDHLAAQEAEAEGRVPSVSPTTSEPGTSSSTSSSSSSSKLWAAASLLTSLLSPRGRSARRVEAAIVLQRYARGRIVRVRWRRKRRAARLLQRRWRRAAELAQKKLRAIVLIQRLCKGHLERQRVHAEFQWSIETERSTKDTKGSDLIRRLTGLFEKRSMWRKWSLFGLYEMVLWQERLVSTTEAALVYQRVTVDGEPDLRSVPREVPYASMTAIKALPNDCLLVKCVERDFCFQLPDAAMCERWVTHLVRLASFAGHRVAGSVVVAIPQSVLAESAARASSRASRLERYTSTMPRDEYSYRGSGSRFSGEMN